MPTLLIVGISSVMLVLIATSIWLMVAMRRQRQQLLEANNKTEQLSSMVSGLCAAAVGVDKRVVRLEQKGRDLEHRQESFETQQQDERPYGEAIQLVHRGATASRLIEELGLSHSEADLVVMLHGMQKQVS